MEEKNIANSGENEVLKPGENAETGIAQNVEQPSENSVSTDKASKKEPADFKTELFDWFESIVFSIVIVFIVLTFGVRTVGVDGFSMVPTLHDKDLVVMHELFYKPKVGDVVVITKLERPLVKRIIATGGQEVDIDFEEGIVYVNGVKRDEPYVNSPTNRMEDVDFPVVVPEGHVFVMGDNRNASSDSRTSTLGFVDDRYVMGRVFFRIAPINNIGTIKSHA